MPNTEQETAAEFLGELHAIAGDAPSGYAVYAYVVGLVAGSLTDEQRAEIAADARQAFPRPEQVCGDHDRPRPCLECQ
jgi:hypothetical protein